MLKSVIAVSAGLIGGAHAFWRMECPQRVGLARLDPIVNPGSVSMHAHSIHGSSGKHGARSWSWFLRDEWLRHTPEHLQTSQL